MAFTAADVKKLREMTSVGMMDCKKALTEADGDFDKAIELLREKGLAKAAKKADRIAAEGLVKATVCDECGVGAIIEVNSETDFVAKNETFTSFVEAVNAAALASDLQGGKDGEDIEALLAVPFEGATVKDVLVEKTATIGEKLSIRRFEKVAGDVAVSYIHGGGRIGVLVEADTAVVNDAVKEALKNVAMQVAALNAKYVSQADVDADYIAHEKEILLAQIMNDPKESQKPEKVIQGMISGRINKEMKEICLLDQVYVKAEDGKQSVAKYLDEVGKANGTTITLKKFVRFETGEGLEKKNEDFAAEVAAQMNA